MTLTITVTKESVTKLNTDDYQISIEVKVVNETSEVLLEKTYSERYYSGVAISSIKIKLQTAIATDWDKLVAEDNIYDAPAFDTMVSEIQTAANGYING